MLNGFIEIDDFTQRKHFRLFRFLAHKVSFTFAVALFSSQWIWIAACYAVYFVYATASLSFHETYAGIKFLVSSTVIVILIHMIHYGMLNRLGIPGWGGHVRLLNRYADDDFIFRTHQFLENEEIRQFYEALLDMPRKNLIVSCFYSALVVLGVGIFYHFYLDLDSPARHMRLPVMILAGGSFTTVIYGYLVYNFTEYLIGPYKEKIERIVLTSDRNFSGRRYLLSFRYKAVFTVLLILVSMITLTIFVWTSIKPLVSIIPFILMSVLGISFLLFIVVNNFSLELKHITRAAKELAAGGDGLYYPYFMNKEIKTFSIHYNEAAKEIREIRHDLDMKVNEKTEELQRAYDTLNTLYRQVQSDLILSKRIQEGILTRRFDEMKNLDIFIRYFPMKEVGGDLYDINEIRPGLIRIFLADAEGHGVQAALVTMIIKAEYEKVRYSENPAVLLEKLNNSYVRLYEHLDVFFSCVIVDIDSGRNVLSYSSAGHPGQYLLTAEGIVDLNHTGKLVGIVPGTVYRSVEHPVKRGDRVILFTDGLFEEFNEDEEEFGEQRLRSFIEENQEGDFRSMLRALLQALRSYLGNPEKISLHDDITLLGIEYRGGN